MTTEWIAALRADIAKRAKKHAQTTGCLSYSSKGKVSPTILFKRDEARGTHGNFHPRVYAAILANPEWRSRLKRTHSRLKALPGEHQDARELDSSNSSDALLMNCFCYPGAAAKLFRELLPEWPSGKPQFGADGDVPLRNGRSDTTKIDMKAGDVIIESKLTEKDFTTASAATMQRYRDFDAVFNRSLIARSKDRFEDYQLLRNVLAAQAHGYYFALVCDGRRPDLLRRWWRVFGAIRHDQLRSRCAFVLWQEIATRCPPSLQLFLFSKYGIG